MGELRVERSTVTALSKEQREILVSIPIRKESWMKALLRGEWEWPTWNKVNSFIAYDENDSIVGWCTTHHVLMGFAPNPEKKVRCYEYNIVVDPSQRGKGIGTNLLHFVKEAMKPRKRGSIAFPHSEAGKKTYEKIGIRCKAEGDVEYTPAIRVSSSVGRADA